MQASKRMRDRGRADSPRASIALRRSALTLLASISCLLALAVSASSAGAALSQYSATKTIPVPPASNFAGTGGGDGWAVALSNEAVYNVFHHGSEVKVACHLQANAQPCWSPREYDTITETGTGASFSTSGHPGLYLDQKTGHLYVYATRNSDESAGVVCIDTTQPASNENPFCGYTQLTGAGEAPRQGGISAVTAPMQIGSHWYAFNVVDGTPGGAKDALLCFDLAAAGPCGGQPYALSLGSGQVNSGSYPPPAAAVIGGKAIVPVDVEGENRIACYDPATGGNCSGSWPIKLSFFYVSGNGAPYPLLDAAGKTNGLCLPTGTDQCFGLGGEEVATPSGMTEAISATSGWNGASVQLGPRVYVPNGNSDMVDCFDYATGKSCANFPKQMQNLDLMYTVNADPQRPSCIWVNSDNGSAQIQNFDAYTGEACGQGTIRALASQFVVPAPQCTPASYVSVQVLKPARSSYTTGIVGFDDGDGVPIGLPEVALDASGTASLAGLSLNTATGLPQFLFTLTGETAEVGAVEVKLTWLGDYDATCIGEGTSVGAPPAAETKVLGTKTVKSRKCMSARAVTVHWTSQKSGPLKKIVLSLNGKVYKRLTGSARKAKISFAGRTKGAVTLKIDGTTASGKHWLSVRTFHPCAAKVEDTKAVTLFLRHHKH